MTTIKARAPLSTVTNNVNKNDDPSEADITVEEFLNRECEQIITELRAHGAHLIEKLRRDHKDGVAAIRAMIDNNSAPSNIRLCVTLKCISGPHIGQKFRLEPATENGEDVFKVGRSTGRHFKEKGVSLYKDKEISTTHAKIEIRNGQVFFVDANSTNGSQINNGDELDGGVPVKLNEGDVITMGSTEMIVSITDMADAENLGYL